MSQKPENAEKKEHFANENVQVEAVFRPHCGVQFRLQIQPIAIEAARQFAFKSLKKEVSVPGFRRGKVPDAFVHKHYAKAWEEGTQEKAIRLGLQEAVQLSGLHPISGFNNVLVQDWNEEKGFSFTAEFQVRPSVPDVDVENLCLQEVLPAVASDRNVELRLHKVLMPLATLQPITDRGAQEGDVGEFDLFLLVEPRKQIVEQQRLEIEEEEFADWMLEQMRGMRPGETRCLEPNEADKQRGMVPLEVHLRELFSVTWPDLTQEEVLKQLKVESEEDLRGRLKRRLEKEADLKADLDMSHQMVAALLTKYSFDLPTAIVYPRLEEYLRVYSEKNKEESVAKDPVQVKRFLIQKAVEDIQTEMLLDSIGHKHGIVVGPEDVADEMLFQLELLPMGQHQVDILSNGKEKKERLEHFAFMRKVRRFLFSKTPKEAKPLSVDSQEG